MHNITITVELPDPLPVYEEEVLLLLAVLPPGFSRAIAKVDNGEAEAGGLAGQA